MDTIKTPGVYITENAKLPPTIQAIDTAIPVFIGFTEKVKWKEDSLVHQPRRIRSLKEYEEIFGMADPSVLQMNIQTVGGKNKLVSDVTIPAVKFRMYYCLQLYFANGGGPCYVVSAASYKTAADNAAARYTQLKAGLNAAGKEDEPTLILFPDALLLDAALFYQLYKEALVQCSELKDRMTIVDVFALTGGEKFATLATEFRAGIGDFSLRYGAAYYPYLRTTLLPYIDEAKQKVPGGTLEKGMVLRMDEKKKGFTATKSLYHADRKLYDSIKKSVSKLNLVLPPSAAIAGLYHKTDAERGVWKAPANVALNAVKEVMVQITDEEQQDMNVTSSGKSVNAIRSFTGKGILVWGARTLAGNDNEWKYVPVRRFVMMVEESIDKGLQWVVFEPNDANTWVKIRGMIENFLTGQWRSGALQGAKTDQAFYVRVGLEETMTAQDILEGRMIVEVGLAVLKPAEFIILCFSRMMAKV